jgi:ferredoxin
MWLLGLSLGLSQSLGVERFPPPEFEADYVMPHPTTPAPRATVMEYLDVAVLLAALSLAAWFVLGKRSRVWIASLTVFSLLYFGFYRKGCICPVGSTQDVALALFQSHYVVPVSVVIFFLAPLLFALFFGRVFCAAVCPLGAIQDLVLFKPVRLPTWLREGLSLIPFVYLGVAVLMAATASSFLICKYDPFVGFFRRSGPAAMLGFGAALLALGIFVGRPYCRFLCPYGALLSLFSRVSRWNVTLSPQDCIRCQLCDVACPYDMIDEPTPKGSPGGLPVNVGRFATYALVLPLLVALGVGIGFRLGTPLSQTHPIVKLAEAVAAEDAGILAPGSEITQAFRQAGRPAAELTAEALQIRAQFAWGGSILGGFVGLVVGLKLLGLTLPSRRESYDPRPGDCVACGRCYTYCPKEVGRKKQLTREKAAPLSAA